MRHTDTHERRATVNRRLRRMSNAALARHRSAGLVTEDGVIYFDIRRRCYHVDELQRLPAGITLLKVAELPLC